MAPRALVPAPEATFLPPAKPQGLPVPPGWSPPASGLLCSALPQAWCPVSSPAWTQGWLPWSGGGVSWPLAYMVAAGLDRGLEV